jgi:ribonuclease HI
MNMSVMLKDIRVYADGGVIESNPSTHGGVGSYYIVGSLDVRAIASTADVSPDGETDKLDMCMGSSMFYLNPDGREVITNNCTEFLAAIAGIKKASIDILRMKDEYTKATGKIHRPITLTLVTDSQTTQHWIKKIFSTDFSKGCDVSSKEIRTILQGTKHKTPKHYEIMNMAAYSALFSFYISDASFDTVLVKGHPSKESLTTGRDRNGKIVSPYQHAAHVTCDLAKSLVNMEGDINIARDLTGRYLGQKSRSYLGALRKMRDDHGVDIGDIEKSIMFWDWMDCRQWVEKCYYNAITPPKVEKPKA